MTVPSADLGTLPAALVNHLWQSTVFCLLAGLLTLVLQRNSARTRFWVWWVASVKFLVPFSLLIAAGARLPRSHSAAQPPPAYAFMMEGLAQPFPVAATSPAQSVPSLQPRPGVAEPSHPSHHVGWPSLLLALWLAGTGVLLLRWARRWLQLQAVLRSATPLPPVVGLPVRSARTSLEPGVFGVFRPVLLMPEGITQRLTAAQLDAIFAHELCHVRRRDNLLAAVHMLVEALFWFHPLLWFVGARQMEERERACDEAVLEGPAASLEVAETYAEGILNVCKFYTEAAFPCVAGVTGSELKQRITRILTGDPALALTGARKLLLASAAALALAAPVGFGLLHARVVHAQTAAAKDTSIEGTWQGTLHAGQDLRTIVKISKTSTGALKADFYTIDQSPNPIPVSSISFDSGTLKYNITAFDINYEGKMSADGTTITGTHKQGTGTLPLNFTRATADTAWEIPTPPPPMKPMPADANPSFEVATIKPSKPDQQGKLFTVRGRRLVTINTSLVDLITIAYGIQAKQLVGQQPWMDGDKYDIEATPDVDGMPNDRQLKLMLKKLLADRFELKFHNDTRELSAYVLTVAKGGPKMEKSDGDANSLPGLFFPRLGQLNVRNATMTDFTQLMQQAVLDRPIVDQTGITGKWNFILKWTPDETQFGGMGAKLSPPPPESAEPDPPLFTAMPQEIGLRLDATKTAVPVFVIDHVAKPTEN